LCGSCLSPVLKIGTTRAFLSSAGKTPDAMLLFIIAAIAGVKISPQCLMIFGPKPSNPAALLTSSLSIILRTSYALMNSKSRVDS